MGPLSSPPPPRPNFRMSQPHPAITFAYRPNLDLGRFSWLRWVSVSFRALLCFTYILCGSYPHVVVVVVDSHILCFVLTRKHSRKRRDLLLPFNSTNQRWEFSSSFKQTSHDYRFWVRMCVIFWSHK
jgi:hypothetical protein